MIRILTKYFFDVILFRLLYKSRITGLENIPKDEAVILAANHASFLDAQILYYFTPRRLYSITADWLYRIWWLGWILTRLDCIPAKACTAGGAVATLNKGRAVLIFPEGLCTCNGFNDKIALSRPHKGVAVFSLKTGTPVIPIGIKGTSDAWPITKKIPRFFKTLEVNIGQPINLGRYVGSDPIPENLLQTGLDRVMSAIKELL